MNQDQLWATRTLVDISMNKIHARCLFIVSMCLMVCLCLSTLSPLEPYQISTNRYILQKSIVLNETLVFSGESKKSYILTGALNISISGRGNQILQVWKANLTAVNIHFVNSYAETGILIVQSIVRMINCTIKNHLLLPGAGAYVYGSALFLIYTSVENKHSVHGCCINEPYNPTVAGSLPFLGRIYVSTIQCNRSFTFSNYNNTDFVSDIFRSISHMEKFCLKFPMMNYSTY
jgi:hypothetical protein